MPPDHEDLMSVMYSGISAIEDGKIDEIEITREWEYDDRTEGVHVVLRRNTHESLQEAVEALELARRMEG